MKTRVLVTGGASLVGSHLCDRLLGQGHEVIAVDDLSRGSWANLAHLAREPRFVFEEHDVAQPFRARVDAVFHLALPASRHAHEADPIRATTVALMGTLHVLEAAEASGARVVLAGSPERYGEGARCAEALAGELARLRGVDVRVVRVARAYGPRMAPTRDHPVSRLVLDALGVASSPPDPDADVAERLTFVDDAVETLSRIMFAARATPPVVAPFLDVSPREVAVAIALALGRPPVEGSGVRPAPVPRATAPDALSAAFVLGQPAPLDLREGVARTVRWFVERLERRPVRRRPGAASAGARHRAS